MFGRTSDFDFALPPELIAQEPAPERDRSRLLVLHRTTGGIEHRVFSALPEYLQAGDVLVLNNSRVIPARLRGANLKSGGKFELLMLEENAINDWWVMLRPGKRARTGTRIGLLARDGTATSMVATVLEVNEEGHRRVQFSGTANILESLDQLGEVPLPPYINRPDSRRHEEDRGRYQTVFAQPPGSVAAPTAGLHFTEGLLRQLREKQVEVCFVTLHVGLGTFAPVKSETVSAHIMHEERYELPESTAAIVNHAKAEGRRVLAVGTTTVRVLESASVPTPHSATSHSALRTPHSALRTPHSVRPGAGRTRIFIYPPYRFQVVDALMTNFHLPRSTLLMLVSAFAAPGELRGRDIVLAAYAEAIRQHYRFFSYGDAMLLL